jgi:hypothetical protein
MADIAQSLRYLLSNDIVAPVLDRAEDIGPTMSLIRDAWSVDLLARKPSPAFREVNDEYIFVEPSNLGLQPWLATIAQRQGVVILPTYESMRPKSQRSDQTVISQKDRKGNLVSITSNDDSHAFSIRMRDTNVIQQKGDKQEIGAWRNFAVVDDSGNLYSGWKTLEFLPTATEKNYIRDNKQADLSGRIPVQSWVHPNVAHALMGSRYLSTNIAEQRVTEQKKFYRAMAKDLRESGVSLPEDTSSPIVTSASDYNTKRVSALEARVAAPGSDNILGLLKGAYAVRGEKANGKVYEIGAGILGRTESMTKKQDALRYAENEVSRMTGYQGSLRSATRTVELAAKQWIDENGSLPNVGWNTPEWSQGKLKPSGRTVYNTMSLPDVVLAYRVHDVTVHTK